MNAQSTLSDALAVCEQALKRTEIWDDDQTYAAMPAASLAPLIAAARAYAALVPLVAFVREADRRYNTVDEVDFNTDSDFDGAMGALHFWVEDNWPLVMALESEPRP